MKALLSVLWTLTCVYGCHAQTGDDAKNLRTQLFVTDAYDKKIIPSADQSYSKDVYVSFYLLAINGLDEVTETLKTTGYLWISWYDDFLVWDPSYYGGIEYYLWPQNDVWKPDVTLKNSIKEYKELGAEGLNVEVYSDGTVAWYPFQVFQSTCSVDITYFPFDVQTCHLTFVAWSYTSYEVTMYGGSTGIDLDQYEESSLWKVIDSSWSSEIETGESTIKFTIKMKRKPLYFLLSVIMPIVMLAVLNVFVFTLPCESGERAGYAITVFLALAVFLTIISSTLPANSESVAIFSVYVIIQTLQSTITTLMALITIRLCARETEVPVFFVKLTHLTKCVPCKRPKRKISAEPSDSNTNKKFSISVIHNLDDTKTVSKEKGLTEERRNVPEEADTYEDTQNVTWPMAVHAIDLILFAIFSTIFAVSTTVCFVIAATST